MASFFKKLILSLQIGKIKRHLNLVAARLLALSLAFRSRRNCFYVTHFPLSFGALFKQAILSLCFINAIPTANNTVAVMISYY